MSVFRTRKIKTKYAKFRKKQEQLRHNRAITLSKKNWIVSNTMSDVLPLFQTVSYVTTLKSNYYENLKNLQKSTGFSSFYVTNSFPFYDSTVKMFSIFKKGLSFFSSHKNLTLAATLQSSSYPDGLVFYCASTTLFFTKFRALFCNPVVQFNYVFLSRNQFAYADSLLAQDGVYIIVYPCDKVLSASLPLLFLTLFEVYITESKSFFDFESTSFFVFLGFFFRHFFYNFLSLIAKFNVLGFFFQRLSVQDTAMPTHVFSELTSLKEKLINEKDSELFLEAGSEDEALDIQKACAENPNSIFTFKKELLAFFENQSLRFTPTQPFSSTDQSSVSSVYLYFGIDSFEDGELVALESFFNIFLFKF